jgi:hypothetical protein
VDLKGAVQGTIQFISFGTATPDSQTSSNAKRTKHSTISRIFKSQSLAESIRNEKITCPYHKSNLWKPVAMGLPISRILKTLE